MQQNHGWPAAGDCDVQVDDLGKLAAADGGPNDGPGEPSAGRADGSFDLLAQLRVFETCLEKDQRRLAVRRAQRLHQPLTERKEIAPQIAGIDLFLPVPTRGDNGTIGARRARLALRVPPLAGRGATVHAVATINT